MFDDGFGILLSKFSDDARLEIKRHERVAHLAKQRHLASERLRKVVKRVFLLVMLLAVGTVIYFGHDLGMMMGETHYSASAETDATLRGVPEVATKRLRRMQDVRARRDADLREVEEALDPHAQ